MSTLPQFAKFLIFSGIIFICMGLLLLLLSGIKIPWLGKLPGDIYIQKENFRFFFPLTTCLLLSLLLTLILFLINRFK